MSDHEGALGRRWASFPVPERFDWHPPEARIARRAVPPGEATSRGNARIASSRPSGRPRGGWSGIGEPFGTCSESISIAEAFEGCPARARADESRSRAGLAVTARAARRKQASTTYRPSAGCTGYVTDRQTASAVGRSLRGGRRSRARDAGRVDARQDDGPRRVGGRRRCSAGRRECQRFDGDAARGRKRRGGGSQRRPRERSCPSDRSSRRGVNRRRDPKSGAERRSAPARRKSSWAAER